MKLLIALAIVFLMAAASLDLLHQTSKLVFVHFHGVGPNFAGSGNCVVEVPNRIRTVEDVRSIELRIRQGGFGYTNVIIDDWRRLE